MIPTITVDTTSDSAVNAISAMVIISIIVSTIKIISPTVSVYFITLDSSRPVIVFSVPSAAV